MRRRYASVRDDGRRLTCGDARFLLYQAPTDADRRPMRQVHIVATWRSEHVVALEDEDGLENLVEVLQAQSNVKLVGYTAQPLDEAVDAAIDGLLDR
jgi:hypothetical protein